jgi:hypothetical protein
VNCDPPAIDEPDVGGNANCAVDRAAGAVASTPLLQAITAAASKPTSVISTPRGAQAMVVFVGLPIDRNRYELRSSRLSRGIANPSDAFDYKLTTLWCSPAADSDGWMAV